MKRGESVTVRSAGGGLDWHEGFTAFRDTDADGVQDTGEQSVRVANGLDGPFTVTASTSQVRYLPAGSLSISPAPVNFTVCRSDRPGEPGRQVAISPTGQASVSEVACP